MVDQKKAFSLIFSRDHCQRYLKICNKLTGEHRGKVVITTAQLLLSKPELRFCAGSNSDRGVSEIRDGEDL